MTEKYMTAKEAAKICGISDKTFKVCALNIQVSFVVGKQRTKLYPHSAVMQVKEATTGMVEARDQTRMFDAEITEGRKNGLSYGEIAQALGIDRNRVKNRCHQLGLGGRNIEPEQFALDEKAVAENVRGSGNHIEYVSGYTRSNGKVLVRCSICGYEWEAAYITAAHQKCCCPWCKEGKREYDAYMERLCKNVERINKNLTKWLKKREQEKQWIALHTHTRTCPVCGKEFTATGNRITCSNRCGRKYANRKGDKRIDQSIIDDRDITLESLFKRDKGICHICGKPCDYEDYTVDGDVFIAGNWYPSIDHVVPVSKGGRHSWENVKLAHRLCNSVKSNKT